MKSIRFDRHGEPAKVLAVEERPLPEPGKGEVRIRILASPVNPSDLLFDCRINKFERKHTRSIKRNSCDFQEEGLCM